jgi:acetyltransferase-like isoleucine patch superfamily enzyme
MPARIDWVARDDLCGLTIGEEAVIGAGAVGTGDVAPGTVVIGVPARVVER